MIEAVIEGGVEVASPPHSAGRRGLVKPRDWDAIAAWVAERPGRWFRYDVVPAGEVADLRERFPEIEWVGWNNRVQHQVGSTTKRVCDIYVRVK